MLCRQRRRAPPRATCEGRLPFLAATNNLSRAETARQRWSARPDGKRCQECVAPAALARRCLRRRQADSASLLLHHLRAEVVAARCNACA